MDDILLFQENDEVNIVSGEADQDESIELSRNNLSEVIIEDGMEDNKSDFFVSDNYVPDDVYSSEIVSVNSLIPEGSVINNNYSIYVSGNEVSENVVSYNVINKPLNEYTTQEGLTLLSLFMLFAFGFVLVVRKGVVPWN